jgi:hypothetical protein
LRPGFGAGSVIGGFALARFSPGFLRSLRARPLRRGAGGELPFALRGEFGVGRRNRRVDLHTNGIEDGTIAGIERFEEPVVVGQPMAGMVDNNGCVPGMSACEEVAKILSYLCLGMYLACLGKTVKELTADLPVVEEIIDPKEVQTAPEDWRLIGAVVSEQLDYEPGRFLH